jgi:hypothetical protein
MHAQIVTFLFFVPLSIFLLVPVLAEPRGGTQYSTSVQQTFPQGRVEYFIEGKRGPGAEDLCEDGLFFNEHYLLVVDGASDKTGLLYEGHTGGWICKEAVLEVFAGLSGRETPFEILERGNASRVVA